MRGAFTGHWMKLGKFLEQVYVHQGMRSFYANLCSGLGELVPGCNVFIGEHDMRRTLVTGCAVRHMFETPDFLEIVNSCAGEHPLWEPIRTGGQIVRCISDFASTRDWENKMLFQEALGLEGVRDHISIEFGNRSEKIVSVGVFRDARGFSDTERETMRFLIPHLEIALRNARIADEREALLDRAAGALHLDMDGRLLSIPPGASATLAPFFGNAQITPRKLPPALACWIAHCRGLFQRGALEEAVPPLRIRRSGRSLELRFAPRHLQAGYVIHYAISAVGEHTHGKLSPRELEVLRWIAEGKSNAEIAIILQTGLSTIKTHAHRILQKLGVENRTSAALYFRRNHPGFDAK